MGPIGRTETPIRNVDVKGNYTDKNKNLKMGPIGRTKTPIRNVDVKGNYTDKNKEPKYGTDWSYRNADKKC